MAFSITHAFVSAKSDGVDTTLIQPSNWNAALVATMATGRVLGRTTASTGAVEELQMTGTGKVVMDTSPNFTGPVGIGMTPTNVLDITASAANQAQRACILNANAGAASTAVFRASNGTQTVDFGVFGTGFTTAGAFTAGSGHISAGASAFVLSATNFKICPAGSTAEAARFNSNNSFLVGSTTEFGGMDNGGGQIGATRGFASSANYGLAWSSNTSIYGVDSTHIRVQVTTNGVELLQNAGAWSAISDYRAKDLHGPFEDSGSIIDAIPVHLAQLKNKTQPIRPMFLAHEVAEGGAAFAVHGEKDAVNGDGDALLQQIESTDPLVPIMWAELRALRARVAALESRAGAL